MKLETETVKRDAGKYMVRATDGVHTIEGKFDGDELEAHTAAIDTLDAARIDVDATKRRSRDALEAHAQALRKAGLDASHVTDFARALR